MLYIFLVINLLLSPFVSFLPMGDATAAREYQAAPPTDPSPGPTDPTPKPSGPIPTPQPPVPKPNPLHPSTLQGWDRRGVEDVSDGAVILGFAPNSPDCPQFFTRQSP